MSGRPAGMTRRRSENKRKLELVKFISQTQPRFKDIWKYSKKELGFSSKGSLNHHLNDLCKRRWVEKDKEKGTYKITEEGFTRICAEKPWIRKQLVHPKGKFEFIQGYVINSKMISFEEIDKRLPKFVRELKNSHFGGYGIEKFKFGGRKEAGKEIWLDGVRLIGPGPFKASMIKLKSGHKYVLPIVSISVARILIVIQTYFPPIKSKADLRIILTKKEAERMLKTWADAAHWFTYSIAKRIFGSDVEFNPVEVRSWVSLPQFVMTTRKHSSVRG